MDKYEDNKGSEQEGQDLGNDRVENNSAESKDNRSEIDSVEMSRQEEKDSPSDTVESDNTEQAGDSIHNDSLNQKSAEQAEQSSDSMLRDKDDVMEPERKGNSLMVSILKEAAFYIVVFFLCVFIVPRYVVQKTIVDGPSMENTLHNGDHLLMEKVSYRFTDPDRFDIVVFHPYGKDTDEYYVKRVIGLPGETIQIIGSEIYINGEVLHENYGKDPITYAGIAIEPITLADDEFFLMGDNRDVSLDSRYDEVGLVHRDLIAGHAFVRIWPLNAMGILD